MKRIFWLTDLHLNFLSPLELRYFFNTIKCDHPDGLFITGDISTGSKVVEHLLLLEKQFNIPIYFVLGNHDYWNFSFEEIEAQIENLCKNSSNLKFLTQNSPITISKDVAVIGHDSFCDSRWHEPMLPLIFLFDWFFINNFKSCSIKEKYAIMRDRATMAAEYIGKQLRVALGTHQTVIMLTHFPLVPGRLDGVGKFWAPYNSSKIMAETVVAIMKDYPTKRLIVLAGHVHMKRTEMIADNIELRVGGRGIGIPAVQEVIWL